MHFIDLDSDMDGAGDLLRMMGEGEWGLWLTWAWGEVGKSYPTIFHSGEQSSSAYIDFVENVAFPTIRKVAC